MPKNEVSIKESPLPDKVIPRQVHLMNFPEAMAKVIEGKKVHKLEWKNPKYYAFLNGEFLSLHKPNGINHKWIINAGDLMGEDYIVVG